MQYGYASARIQLKHRVPVLVFVVCRVIKNWTSVWF